jgi:hypothetical protein
MMEYLSLNNEILAFIMIIIWKLELWLFTFIVHMFWR